MISHRRILLGLLPCLALMGCPSTESCPDGQVFAALDGGGWSDVCTPTPAYDASIDAAPSDGGPVDGGSEDGGESDGGLDAGARDAGPDAGPCGECGGETPFCDATSMECIGCRNTADCSDAVCDPVSDSCVACVVDADCTDPSAARCNTDTNLCVGCDSDTQCGGITGTEACDMSAGQCVQCSASNNLACTGRSCTLAGICSEHNDSSRDTCESCDTDVNCSESDDFCVLMTFQSTERGGYCLKDSSAGGCPRPLTVELNGRESLSGETGNRYCGLNEALTTCEAVRALELDDTCTADGDECPEGGICRTVGALVGLRCTYACGGTPECPTTAAQSTCDNTRDTSSVDYCGGGI